MLLSRKWQMLGPVVIFGVLLGVPLLLRLLVGLEREDSTPKKIEAPPPAPPPQPTKAQPPEPWNTPEQVAAVAKQAPAEERKTPPVPPAAKYVEPPVLTADDLYRVYEENEVKADLEFKGRAVKLQGHVERVRVTLLGKAEVEFKLKDRPLFGVYCVLDRDESKYAARFKRGDWIQVVGTCSGKSFGIYLADAFFSPRFYD